MPKSSMTKQKFQNQWLRHFASELTKGQFEKYVKNQFIWHVFSWNLLSFNNLLIGNDARKKFDQMPKTDCICCDLYGNGGVTDSLPPRYSTAEQIDAELTEFYVVSKDYSWTYIKTHEGDLCGPYFLEETI